MSDLEEEGRLYNVEVFVTQRFLMKVRAKNENNARILARNKVSINGPSGLALDEEYRSVSAGDAYIRKDS